MSPGRTDDLINTLAADARPVRPLASPLKRAAPILGLLALGAGLAISFLGDWSQLRGRYAGREDMLVLESAAMAATAVLAIIGAFFVSIPGSSRWWRLAPIPPFLLWLVLSGAGCYSDLVRSGPSGWNIGPSIDCLIFILAVSLVMGAPLIWRLSQALPIDPVPVALLGGLGTAAAAAFMLQFFHPFAVTFLDLAVHVTAIGLVVGATALINRRALSPA
ncbi:MAG: DUF1109 domain-containing protein [Pseudomonadota bacterium]|nr:DUF1109 domain-containing protein [Pseudomonadota bacterium]